MSPRLPSLLLTLFLTACGGGGIDGARVGLPDVAPRALVVSDYLSGVVSEDVDHPGPWRRVVLDARPSVGVRFAWSLVEAPEGEGRLAWRIHQPDRAVTTFAANRPGTYRLRLEVENRTGHRAQGTITVRLSEDGTPLPLTPPSADRDEDGIPDVLDPDSDGDGVLDAQDAAPLDPDRQDWPQRLELESTRLPPLGGNDGLSDAEDLGVMGDGLQILGALVPGDESDLYRVTFPAGRYGLLLMGEDTIPAVGLLDDQGQSWPLDAIPAPAVVQGRAYHFALSQGGERLIAVTGEPTGYTLVLYPDDDGDGLPDALEAALGSDPALPDSDGDGLPDGPEALVVLDGADPDPDGDGLPPWLDEDSDGDGLSDALEGLSDLDGDGLPNAQDPDADGNGLPDDDEAGPLAAVEGPLDSDGDGLPDFLDRDDDADGLLDPNEPAGGRLTRAVPLDPGPELAPSPRLDIIGERDGPDGVCRPGEPLILRGTRLPTGGAVWVGLTQGDQAFNFPPETRSEDRWILPCPDLPPGDYQLHLYHQGRVGSGLPLTIVPTGAPWLTELTGEADLSCSSGYRLRLRGEGLQPPYVLRLEGRDGQSRYAQRLTVDDPEPCLPEGVAEGAAILSTAEGDSPPLWFVPRLNEARFAWVADADETRVLDSGLGAVRFMAADLPSPSLIPLEIAREDSTLVWVWSQDGARVVQGMVLGPDQQEPVLGNPLDLVAALGWWGLGGDACLPRPDEWMDVVADLPEVLALLSRLVADQGLALPPTPRQETALNDFYQALPGALEGYLDEACTTTPAGRLLAFVPVQPEYAGRLAVENRTGLPVALAYRDFTGRLRIPFPNGLRPALPGWLPGPPARLIPGVDGQDGEALLITPARPDPAHPPDGRVWRWAWLIAAARTLFPAYRAGGPPTPAALATAWTLHFEADVDVALETAWAGDPRAALQHLAERLAKAALDGEAEVLFTAPEPDTLIWWTRRNALLLTLQRIALEAGAGPLARLAVAEETAPAQRRYPIDFSPVLLGAMPDALRRDGGDQDLILSGWGLAAVDQNTLGYPRRFLPRVEIQREDERWFLAPTALDGRQRRLQVRLPAFLSRGEGPLRLRIHQPEPDGAIRLLGPLEIPLLERPALHPLGGTTVAPGGLLSLRVQGIQGGPERYRVDLLDEAGDSHPVSVLAREPLGLRVRIPADLALGTYQLRLWERNDDRWLEADYPLAPDGSPTPPSLTLRLANVAFRACDAGDNQDDAFAIYLDGVYQGEYRAAETAVREFSFELPPGSTHRLRLVPLDGGPDQSVSFGLDPLRGLAIFSGRSTGNLALGESQEWVFRVASKAVDNTPGVPACPAP